MAERLATSAPTKSCAAVSVAERTEILDIRAIVLSRRAAACERLRRYAEAKNDYQEAAADFTAIGKLQLAGQMMVLAADLARLKLSAPDEAEGLYARASFLIQEAGMPLEATRVRAGVGWSQIAAGRSAAATEVFTDIIVQAESQGALDVASTGYRGRALSYENRGMFDDALADYQTSVERLRAGGDNLSLRSEADAHVGMGALFQIRGQYERAIESFRRSIERYREALDTTGEAAAVARLADVSVWVGDYRTATEQYQRALALYQTADEVPKQVEVLAALAGVPAVTDIPPETASEYLDRGLALLDAYAKRVGVDHLKILREAWKKAPSRAEVQEFVTEYQSTAPAPFVPSAALYYYTVGANKRIYEAWRKGAAAALLSIDYIRATAMIYQRIGQLHANAETALGFLSLSAMYQASVPMNRDSLIEIAKTWFFAGEAHRRLRRFDEAFRFFGAAGIVAKLLETPELHWATAGMARTYADMGDLEKAIGYYGAAFERLEFIQSQASVEEVKIDVQAGAMYVYREFPRLLLDSYRRSGNQKLFRAAFEYSERLRARSFLALFRRSTMLGAQGDVGSLLTQEEPIRRRVSEIHRKLRAPKLDAEEERRLLAELDRLRTDWQAMQQATTRYDSRYVEVVNGRPAAVTDVQRFIDRDAAFLEYVVAPDGSTLWVITTNQVEAFDLPGRDALPLLEAFLRTLRSPLVGAEEKARHIALGRQLYQRLIGPAARLLEGKARLIVAPDGPLYYLPFESLVLPELETTDDRRIEPMQPRYLLENFSVAYVPSASLFVALHQQRERRVVAPLPLVAFGDPIYEQPNTDQIPDAELSSLRSTVLRGMTLDRLPYSGEEVRSVATVLGVPMDSPHINLRERASVDRLRELDLSKYRIVHFAAHAVIADEVSWATQPALVLSQGPDHKDGSNLLQMADVLALKLNADLVVLSACRTGLGKLREGEGVIGLTRAFFYAGASSVIVSLWPVEDQATSLLMTRFYERLKAGATKDEALRQAKLDVLRTTVELEVLGGRQRLAAPVYWAGFVLVGN
jgi:CHAT domain-containing protein